MLIVTLIGSDPPAQPVPLQPPKVEPPVVAAVRVTTVPLVKVSLQVVAGQSMLPGLEVTVPVPPPARLTVRFRGGIKFAVQVRSAVIVTLAPHPVPLHPANVDPPVAAGVNVTTAPLVKVSLQLVAGQLMLPGLEVTVPLPPDITIVKVRMAVNVAVQPIAADNVTVPSAQSGSPVHPPNVEPAAGIAVSATTVPGE